MEEITPDTNDCEDIVERRTDAEQPRESTGNEDFKVCEKVIETQTNGDPELREIILSLSKKCCDLEENVNEMKKIAAEKNKDLFDLITYQGGEIYKRDQKIRQLEDTLAEKEAIIRNLRGGRQIATREVVDSQPTVDESIDNPVYEEMEEMPVLAAENNLEEIEDQPGSSSGKSREDVERPTRRGRPRKSGTIKIFETRQSAGPVLEAQKSGEMTPKAKKRSLQLIKKERESENKENDQTTSNQRKSPRFRGKTTTPDSEKKKADNDGPPSLPKVKRQRMVEHRDDDKPPMLFAEAEPMTNLNDEDEAEKILRSCQWLRHIAYNFKTGEVYCSLTGQPLTSEQMNLAVERVILLLKLHDNLTAISVLISLEGWALKSPPNVEQVNDAMARLENAGLLKEKGEVYEKIKETEDMKQFKRALAQRGLRLKEYHRVFK